MRILVLAYGDLYHPRGGSPLYCYNRWRRVAKRHELTLVVADAEPGEPDPGIEPPEDWCKKVYPMPMVPTSFPLRLERKLRRSMPWRSKDSGFWMNREVAHQVNRLLREEEFDLVHVEAFMMFWPLPPNPGPPISYSATDIVSRFAENTPQPEDSPLSQFWASCRHAGLLVLEPELWRRADLISTITTIERDEIARQVPGIPIEVVPNGVDLEYFAPSDEPPANPPELCFTGLMLYRPNIDAVVWFCNDILPLVRREVPDVRLTIVGREPAAEVAVLGENPGVEVTGSVPDVRPYIQRATAVIAPVRLGAGMRGKHLEAMAMRKPVVATNFCIEGTACTNGEDILLADDPEGFAAHTVRLLKDPAFAARIGSEGRKLIERDYNWDVSAARMCEYLERCAAGAKARHPEPVEG